MLLTLCLTPHGPTTTRLTKSTVMTRLIVRLLVSAAMLPLPGKLPVFVLIFRSVKPSEKGLATIAWRAMKKNWK